MLLSILLLFFSAAAAWTQPFGSVDLEPALQNRSDILFYEDFESSDWPSHWNLNSNPQNTSLVSDPLYRGNRSLRVRTPAGQHYGTTFGFTFSQHGLEEPEEIYFRYYLYIGPQWGRESQGTIGKLPGLGGTYGISGWGGKPSHGDDGWSSRMLQIDRGSNGIEVGFYTYHADMTGQYGSNYSWNEVLERERWYCVEVYGKINTLETEGNGNNDGVLRGWVDGQQVFEKTDLRFRDVSSLKIEKAWFDIYVGGSWTAPRDMSLYFDNVVVARNYIGPFDSSFVEVKHFQKAPTGLHFSFDGTQYTFPRGKESIEIYDIEGNLIHMILAAPGPRFWNGKNAAGQKIRPGLYLLRSGSRNTQHSKLMVHH